MPWTRNAPSDWPAEPRRRAVMWPGLSFAFQHQPHAVGAPAAEALAGGAAIGDLDGAFGKAVDPVAPGDEVGDAAPGGEVAVADLGGDADGGAAVEGGLDLRQDGVGRCGAGCSGGAEVGRVDIGEDGVQDQGAAAGGDEKHLGRHARTRRSRSRRAGGSRPCAAGRGRSSCRQGESCSYLLRWAAVSAKNTLALRPGEC
ncbi:hypothetical protein LCGC14_2037230 [marine sediment metagenome]|uniref:Uncharacterized protein n=1 Tax=marine sediment metagenome TaxID=412755 RepID=A0A0F9EST3_9ZZZZ